MSGQYPYPNFTTTLDVPTGKSSGRIVTVRGTHVVRSTPSFVHGVGILAIKPKLRGNSPTCKAQLPPGNSFELFVFEDGFARIPTEESTAVPKASLATAGFEKLLMVGEVYKLTRVVSDGKSPTHRSSSERANVVQIS
jgi:hypothetical protein